MAKSKTTAKTATAKKAAKPVAKKAKPAAKPAVTKKAAKKPPAKTPPPKAKAAAKKTAAKPVAKPVAKKVPVKKAAPAKASKAKTPPAKPTSKAPNKITKAQTVKTPTAKTQTKPQKVAHVEKAEKAQAEEKPARKKTEGLTTGGLIPPDYDPTKDKGDFMNPVMREFFRQKLISWRSELLRESTETIHNTLQSTELQKPDMADRAAAETDHALELRTRDRERKLISKINEALLRIDEDNYGYCEETGEPISVARLVARPTATLSLEAQERHERMEKTHRDD